jgi:hypothetical protein
VADSGIGGGIMRVFLGGLLRLDLLSGLMRGGLLRGNVGDSAMYVCASSSGSETSATECRLV